MSCALFRPHAKHIWSIAHPWTQKKNLKKNKREEKNARSATTAVADCSFSGFYLLHHKHCLPCHTRSSGYDPQTFHCLRVCLSRAWRVLFCFLGFRVVFLLLTCTQKVVSPIMVASKAASRAASVMSNSNARGVVKRRNKPYKTEQQKIVAKKRKLDIRVCSSFIPSNMPALQY